MGRAFGPAPRAAAARQLHLGCGGLYRSGFLNVDLEEGTTADVRCHAAALPFAEGSFARVEMIHLIEHLGYRGALHAVAEAFRVLRPGGVLVIETPDLEATFESFLRARSRSRRSELVTWLYGLEIPGYQHRLLFPRELLKWTLRLAGFDRIRQESPRAHLYAPGLRLVARRGSRPVHEILAELRSWLWTTSELDLSNQIHTLEFETAFVDVVLALGGAGQRPPDPVEAALGAVLTAPAAARRWLELCQMYELELPVDGRRLLSVAEAADQERLLLRIEALFAQMCARGARGRDGLDVLRQRGLRALRWAWDAPNPRTRRQALERLLPPPASGAGPLRGGIFSPACLVSAVAARCNQGVRLVSLGRTIEGKEELESAARTGIQPFYARWNLAVLAARSRRWSSCEDHYRMALLVAPRSARGVRWRELAICQLHAGRPKQAEDTALRLPRAGRAAVLHLARRLGLGPLPPSALPRLRTQPVLNGESHFHAPADSR
jgi:SAM-dependent methyltransferase